MNRLVVALTSILLTLALAAAVPSALAEPDPVGELLEKDGQDPAAETPDPLTKAQDEVVPDEPPVQAPGLLEGLLDDAAGLVTGVGAAIADGVGGAVSFLGDMVVAVVTGTVTGTVAAITWSIAGVWGLMTGTVSGLARIITGTTGALWDGLGHLALGLAGTRPDGMSETAWAGTVAVAATGASAAANLGLFEALRRFGWAGAGLPLFSRIAKDDILEHPLRAEIFETIKTNPGIHISALARSVDAGWGTTIHHLRKLQEKELVAVRLVNNQKCFFQNGGASGRSSWTQIPELKNETADRIARFVLAHPLSSVTGLSDALGISPSLVSHHVRKLERAGVVEKHRDGRFVKLAITEDARSNLFEDAAPAPVAETPGVAA